MARHIANKCVSPIFYAEIVGNRVKWANDYNDYRNNPQIRGNEGETEAISGKFAQNKGKGRKIPDSKNIKNEPKYP